MKTCLACGSPELLEITLDVITAFHKINPDQPPPRTRQVEQVSSKILCQRCLWMTQDPGHQSSDSRSSKVQVTQASRSSCK